MSDGEIVHNSINLLGSHPGFNVFCDFIQNSSINLAGFTNAGNLLRRFNHAAVRHFLALGTQQFNFRINHLVAVTIGFAAATPAQIILFFHEISP